MYTLLAGLSFIQCFSLIVIGYLTYSVVRAIYNVYFHPLAGFPGPPSHAAFYFPLQYRILTGDHIQHWHELHKKYGEVVRIAPHVVSTIHPDAWRDIYGHEKRLQKDFSVYARDPGETSSSIIGANDADHARMRRLLNYAFSEQALRSQEDIINSYITRMIEKLHEKAEANTAVDITRWMNAAAFDIAGDLAFDEPFGALEADAHHHWIDNTFKWLKYISWVFALRPYTMVTVPLFALMERIPQLMRAQQRHMNYTNAKLARRLASKTERKDFLGHMIKHNDAKGMTPGELRVTSGVLVVAGSETSATCLSGAIYFLLKHPHWLARLHAELRAAFASESAMTFASLSQLQTLHAILQETLRMYSPVPGDLPRVTPATGAVVCGRYIPPYTRISIPMSVAYRSALNFRDPDTFAPERWLGDEKYADDRRAVLQPFSIGPRNCIGQSLAWAEMRTVLARVVWHFDGRLVDEEEAWAEGQKVRVLWVKPPLMVKLTARC